MSSIITLLLLIGACCGAYLVRDITAAVHLPILYWKVASLLSPARGTVHLVPSLVSRYHDAHRTVHCVILVCHHLHYLLEITCGLGIQY